MTTVIVTWTQPGFHRWEDASNYLAAEHRHLFHLRFELQVGHGNREVEMHWLLEEMKTHLQMEYPRSEHDRYALSFGKNSCEMIATELVTHGRHLWPLRWMAAECWEDGEVGARVELRGQK